jgi:DNA-binding transcriptional LysR family regulator
VAVEELAKSRLVCIVPVGHRLSAQRSIAARHLVGEPLITYSEETTYGRLIQPFLASAGAGLQPAIQVRFTQAACALVQAGAGIALVDAFSVLGSTWSGIVVRPTRPKHAVPLSILAARHEPRSVLATAFLEILRTLARTLTGQAT